jgi:hypothetical protein
MDKRAAFIVNAKGEVCWSKVYDPGTIPESKDLLEILSKL